MQNRASVLGAKGWLVVGRDSEALKEKVRQSSDIVDVVSAYATLKRAGRNLKALCPFHNERTPSFCVLPDKQIFKCFGCGAGGDVFTFVQLKEGVDFPEALRILAHRAHISLEETTTAVTGSVSKNDLERVNRWASRWFVKQLAGSDAASVRKYVADRGISAESVEQFALGFAPAGWQNMIQAAANAKVPASLLVAAGLAKTRDDGSLYDAFRNRLMFPILDAMGRFIGFGGRALDDDAAKYLNSSQSALFDKGRAVYGIHAARHSFTESREAILVEGYIDCIMCWQHGFKNAVATLGTAVTSDHVRLLRRYVDRVCLVFDSDTAGRTAADRSLGVFLTEQLDVRLAHVPEGKDPAEILVLKGSEAFKAVLTSACEALEFKWKQVRLRYRDADTGADRRRAIEEFLSLVAGSTNFAGCDPIQRGLILNQVAKLLGLPSEEVHRQLRIISRRSAPPVSSGTSEKQENVSRPRTAAEIAMQSILEVLIADSSNFESVKEDFDPGVFADGEVQQIAAAVKDMALKGQSFTLSQLIGRFDSVDMARRITDLHLSAERRGEFGATLSGALSCLRAFRQQVRASELVAKLRVDGLSDTGGLVFTACDKPFEADLKDEAERFQMIRDVAAKSGHFAARKHRAVKVGIVADSRSPAS